MRHLVELTDAESSAALSWSRPTIHHEPLEATLENAVEMSGAVLVVKKFALRDLNAVDTALAQFEHLQSSHTTRCSLSTTRVRSSQYMPGWRTGVVIVAGYFILSGKPVSAQDLSALRNVAGV